ncbi:hypothetical protein R1sor_019718 [Riccia sorocarpa]|uniref:Reverse transcriptase n=1 Tax=Riccia sorocarpa TaxID=122646 RepID=A0ABD3IHH0_9MARC
MEQVDSFFASAKIKITSWNVGGLATFHWGSGIHASGRSGGVAILVHKSCPVESWSSFNHRVLVATILINKIRVHVVNIYSPVETDSRKLFWEELLSLLDQRKFLFLGDWNVVEHPSDSSSKSNWLAPQETIPFFAFKARFGLQDIRDCGGEHFGPSFTRFQLRDRRPVWSVLDRVYLPLSLLGGFQKPEVKTAISQIWERHKLQMALDSPQTFFAAWQEIRGVIKDAQYQESIHLSTLDTKKKLLAQMASSGVTQTEDLQRYGELAEEGCWESAEFPACLLEGVIKLNPKELRPESLHQWRPIALLNAHYKLLAKVMAARLAIILPSIVPPQQQGFIQGRNVQACLLNVLLAQDLLRRRANR